MTQEKLRDNENEKEDIQMQIVLQTLIQYGVDMTENEIARKTHFSRYNVKKALTALEQKYEVVIKNKVGKRIKWKSNIDE